MDRREILNEIDTTLDQLIKNGAALQEIWGDPLYETEVEALQKTQESLLAHLLHLHSLEVPMNQTLTSKLELFSELSPTLRKKIPQSKPLARYTKKRKTVS